MYYPKVCLFFFLLILSVITLNAFDSDSVLLIFDIDGVSGGGGSNSYIINQNDSTQSATFRINGPGSIDDVISIGTISADPSAKVDISSTTKGLLIPRMNTAQRDEITSPADGLLIYNNSTNCLDMFNGRGWISFCHGTPTCNSVGGIAETSSEPICAGETSNITLSDFIGNIQWQSSLDDEIFDDIPDATDTTFITVPLPVTTYFRAKVTDETCDPDYSTSTVINVTQPPTTADAGSDQLEVEGNSTTLEGNSPSHGTGTWTIIAGTGGEIVSTNNPNSIFNGQINTAYTLRWTITNPPCEESFDEVEITFGSVPGWYYGGYYWFNGHTDGYNGNGSCDDVCSTQGLSCVQTGLDWALNNDSSCEIAKHFYPTLTSCHRCAIGTNVTPLVWTTYGGYDPWEPEYDPDYPGAAFIDYLPDPGCQSHPEYHSNCSNSWNAEDVSRQCPCQ